MSFRTKVKLLFSGIWGFIGPFVKIFITRMGPVLASAATQAVAVTAAKMAGAEGDEKRAFAFELIVDELKQQGVVIGAEVTTSMINAAIEAAVQKAKAEGA